MIQRVFPSIGARLGFFVTVMLIGYIVVIVSGMAVFNLIDKANKNRNLLLNQERTLHDFHESVLESIILIDRIILEDKVEEIPKLLALNEDSLGYFGRYQSVAQYAGLEHDRYAAEEYEHMVLRIRSDFFEIVSLYRANMQQQAQENRLELMERHLPVLITFIRDARELRDFDIADVVRQISELRRMATITIFAIFLSIMVLIVIIAIALNYSIVKPIEKLKYLVDHFKSTGQISVSQSVSGYNSKDEVAHLTESFRNMSVQIIENELQQDGLIEELGQKNTELERFAYTVSHDLKSPLVTVTGFIGLLERDIANGDSSRVKSDIQKIMSATQTMAALLEDLLELSRIGRQVHPSHEFSLNELSESVIETLQGLIEENRAEIKIQPAMPVVFADQLRIGEIIQNLLENAIKFSGEDNHPRIDISATRKQNKVVVSFKDNGIGIEPRYHDIIFGLFNRLDSNVPGTGVGLALVKRIVEIHGGQIWIESSGDRQGTTFCFTLPVVDLKDGSS